MTVEETKHQKFTRLATARTNEVLDKLRLLGNLSNRAIYEYSEKEIEKIFSNIKEQLRIIEGKFKKPKKKGFKL